MTRRILSFSRLLGFLVVTAMLIPGKARAASDVSAPRDADVDARGAREARIEASAGSLRVDGREGIDRVRVRGTARASSQELLNTIRLIAERRGSEVFIKVDIPDYDRRGRDRNWGNEWMALDLVIEVPRSLALRVHDGSGDAAFYDTGPIELEDGSGNIVVRGARGDVRIADGSGQIDIEGVEGSVEVSDGSGEIRARGVTRDFIVRDDGSGGIDLSRIGGSVRILSDGSGNIDVNDIAGNLVVDKDGSGSVRYASVNGSVSVPERRRHRRR